MQNNVKPDFGTYINKKVLYPLETVGYSTFAISPKITTSFQMLHNHIIK